MVEPVSDRRAPAEIGRGSEIRQTQPARIQSGICSCYADNSVVCYRLVVGNPYCWHCGRVVGVDLVPVVAPQHIGLPDWASDNRVPASVGNRRSGRVGWPPMPDAFDRLMDAAKMCRCGTNPPSCLDSLGRRVCGVCGGIPVPSRPENKVSPAVPTEHGRVSPAPGARPFFCAECGRGFAEAGICPFCGDTLIEVDRGVELARGEGRAAVEAVPSIPTERIPCSRVNLAREADGVPSPAAPEAAAPASDLGEPWTIREDGKAQGMVAVLDCSGELLLECFTWHDNSAKRMDVLRRMVDCVNSAAGVRQ